MKKMAMVLIASFPVFLRAQIDITPTLDLQLGSGTRPLLFLVDIQYLVTGVVFKTWNAPASCPRDVFEDFELKKLNPDPWQHAVTEYIGHDCHTRDSIKVNTDLVYEISTSEDKTYYMRLLELAGSKVKVRITSERPVVGILKKQGLQPGPERGPEYQADGRIGREPGSPVRFRQPSGMMDSR